MVFVAGHVHGICPNRVRCIERDNKSHRDERNVADAEVIDNTGTDTFEIRKLYRSTGKCSDVSQNEVTRRVIEVCSGFLLLEYADY